MQTFEIQEKEAGQRFDKYLKKRLPKAPVSLIYKMLRKKNITLNTKKADGSEILCCKDQVRIFFSEETYGKFSGALTDGEYDRLYPGTALDIVYETNNILVINKPAGMLSQKAKPQDISANEYIIRYLMDTGAVLPKELESFKPSICNRLDRNTSGLLIAGKTMKGLQDMAKQLGERSMQKFYQCLIVGSIKEPEQISGWLTKDNNSNQVTVRSRESAGSSYIETAYRPLRVWQNYTLLEVHLITGRSHQIRAHLSSIGHPIVGDPKYGNRRENALFQKECGISRQLLHAWRMVLADQTEISAEPDGDFARAAAFLDRSVSKASGHTGYKRRSHDL